VRGFVRDSPMQVFEIAHSTSVLGFDGGRL